MQCGGAGAIGYRVRDVEAGAEVEDVEDLESDREAPKKQERTLKSKLDEIRQSALAALGRKEGVTLIAHKRIQFWNEDKKVRAVCAISKLYERGYYWYAFHPYQRQFLAEAKRGFLLLGCVDTKASYAIPYSVIDKLVPSLHVTDSGDRNYWHVHLQPAKNDDCFILYKGGKLSIKPYRVI